MKVARWLLPLVSLLAVLWFTWLDVRAGGTGPGPLHPAHASHASLDGGARCEACHQPGAGVDHSRCVQCHATIGVQLGTQPGSGVGLHGRLDRELALRCERCHPEHHGDEAPLIAAFAFARAGVAEPSAYDHRHVVFTLHGAHEGLACTRCHPQANDETPPAGGRFLGLSQRCTQCHGDAHAGAFGAECAECHGQELPWRRAPGFVHTSLPLSGAHAQVPCATCHVPGSDRDVAAQRRQPPPGRECRACHDDPHDDPPRALLLHTHGDCARCHATTAWSDARPTAAAHAAFGFPLHGPHAAAACGACHGDAIAPARWSGAAPAAGECFACHTSQHCDPLLVGRRCDGCHRGEDTTFAGGRMTPAAHAATGFPLHAPHAAVDCARCHAGTQWRERFPGRAAADCRGCHADAHGGQFAERQCTACHAATHFRPHTFGPLAHAATQFPLTGAHEAVGCDRCHTSVVVGARGVRAFAGTPHACASCHADVHAGRFDRAGLPRDVDGRAGCARCHDTTSFAEPAPHFDHGVWTGHELVGAHRAAACTACHAPAATEVAAAATARRLGKAAGTSCASCHVDPHAGQFRGGAEATDCARCHEPTRFTALRFDHQRDSRFRLDDVHRTLPCSACHVAHRAGERAIVRYRPLGTACGDCHRLGGNTRR